MSNHQHRWLVTHKGVMTTETCRCGESRSRARTAREYPARSATAERANRIKRPDRNFGQRRPL